MTASLVLALAACSTPPATHWHTLMPVDLAPRPRASDAAPTPIAIVLEPVRLPAQVDQPQWLVRLPDDSLAVLEQERWAAPLRDEIRQALLEALIVGHRAVDARTQPVPAAAPVRVGVDIRRFESLPGREARIEGSWTLVAASPRGATSRCDWQIRETATGPIGALAAAHRRAIARLGDAIGEALVRLGKGDAAACPALDGRG